MLLKQEDFVKKKDEKSSPKQEDPKKKEDKVSSRSGLSCLRPTTLDEDTEAFTRSPERREATLSPGGRSISDIFGKVCMENRYFNYLARKSGSLNCSCVSPVEECAVLSGPISGNWP